MGVVRNCLLCLLLSYTVMALTGKLKRREKDARLFGVVWCVMAAVRRAVEVFSIVRTARYWLWRCLRLGGGSLPLWCTNRLCYGGWSVRESEEWRTGRKRETEREGAGVMRGESGELEGGNSRGGAERPSTPTAPGEQRGRRLHPATPQTCREASGGHPRLPLHLGGGERGRKWALRGGEAKL